MGCLNSKSSTADGKKAGKLPPKNEAAQPPTKAPAAAAAKKTAPAPKDVAAAPAPKDVAAAPAPKDVAAAPAPKDVAAAPAKPKEPAQKAAADAAEATKKTDAGAPQQGSTSADASAPPSAPSTKTPTKSRAAPAQEAKPKQEAPATPAENNDANAQPTGNALATILRKQVEDYESRRQSEDRGDDADAGSRKASLTLDQDESAILPDEAEEIKEAAVSYNASYKERMGRLQAPRKEDNAAPFIGFSLADNIKDGVLVVDGVFHDGPAYQVGVDVDHELVSVAGKPTSTILATRELVTKHCRPGRITKFKFRNPKGESYEAPLYVLTADRKYEGKPYFFDTAEHEITQSDRLKQTWRPSASPDRPAET